MRVNMIWLSVSLNLAPHVFFTTETEFQHVARLVESDSERLNNIIFHF